MAVSVRATIRHRGGGDQHAGQGTIIEREHAAMLTRNRLRSAIRAHPDHNRWNGVSEDFLLHHLRKTRHRLAAGLDKVNHDTAMAWPQDAGRNFHPVGASSWTRVFQSTRLTIGPLCLQKHACHVAAGWALIPDQSRFICERRNPHHLVHYGFASRACKAAASRKVRHDTRPFAIGFKSCTPLATTRQLAAGSSWKKKEPSRYASRRRPCGNCATINKSPAAALEPGVGG
jgi:hypothetical protein